MNGYVGTSRGGSKASTHRRRGGGGGVHHTARCVRVAHCNDLLIPLAISVFLFKKVLDRWIAFPDLRCRYVWLIHPLAKLLVDRFKDGEMVGWNPSL